MCVLPAARYRIPSEFFGFPLQFLLFLLRKAALLKTFDIWGVLFSVCWLFIRVYLYVCVCVYVCVFDLQISCGKCDWEMWNKTYFPRLRLPFPFLYRTCTNCASNLVIYYIFPFYSFSWRQLFSKTFFILVILLYFGVLIIKNDFIVWILCGEMKPYFLYALLTLQWLF